MQKNSKAKNKGKVVKNKKNKSQKLPMILLIGAIVLIVAGVGGYLLANKGLPGGGFNIMKPQPVDDGCKVQYCTNCKPNNPNYCVTCSSGYTQQNGKCVKNQIKVKSIALSPSSLSTNGKGDSGDNNYLSVIITPSNASNKNYTCVSSNTSIAIATAKYNGCVITHPKNNPTSKGKVTITVISKDGNKKASATINMLPFIEVKSIGFQQSTYSLNVGHNMTLYKVVNPTNAHYGKVHSCGVENNGVLKLVEEPTTGCRVRGLKKGTAKVTIWDATGAYKGVATVKVK